MFYHPPPNSVAWNERHDIYFFTIHPDRRRLLIGADRSARFLTVDESTPVRERVGAIGVLEMRADQLAAVPELNLDRDQALRLLEREFEFTLSVAPEDVEICEPRELTPDSLDGRNPVRVGNYYSTPTFFRATECDRPSRKSEQPWC